MYENFASVVILILLAVTLPKTPAEKHINYDALDADTNASAPMFPIAKTFALGVSVAFANLVYCVMAYQYAMYLPANFPSLEPATIALLGAVEAVAGGVSGFIFGFIFRFTKRFTVTIAFALYGVAFLLFGFANTSLVLVGLGLAINGFSFGLSLSYYYSYTAAVYHPRHESTIAGFLTVGMGLGMFFNTFLTTFFTGALGLVSFDSVTEMPVTDLVAFMPYVAAVAFVCMALSLVLAIKDRMTGAKLSAEPGEK
jgi:MFS family permease